MSDQSRRKLLKSIATGSGAIIAGKNLPESWSRPVVDSVLLPAHAQTSARTFSGNNLQALLNVEKSFFARASEVIVPEAKAGDEVTNQYIVDACATELGSNLDVTVQVIDTEVPETHEYKALLPIAGGAVSVSPVDLCPTLACTTTLDMEVVSVESGAIINLVGLGEINIPSASDCVEFSDPQCPLIVSDRAIKDNFEPIDEKEILRKVSSLKIETWNYTDRDHGVRHIGPMAQDFMASFNVGDSEKHIHMVDANGVNLAAIKALNASLEEKDLQIKALQSQLDEVFHRLEKLT